MNGKGHVPVLVREVLEYLDAGREGTYIDCTLGLGGHAEAILQANPRASLIGFDLDELALVEAKRRLAPFGGRVDLFHSDYRYLPDLNIPLSQVRGILLDLGLCSFQLDSPERGFSFNLDGPLDMRMDLRKKVTAAKILQKYSEPKLAEIFRDYGELRQARPLAHRIVSLRKTRNITTTTELRHIVEEVCRWHPQKGKLHPAAKVFQALRIEVNQELEGFPPFLEKTLRLVPQGTRMVVLSFHSLEDRAVKKTFVQLSHPDDGKPLVRLLTHKPVLPSPEEVEANPRSHSAKLRAVEKL